MQEIAKYMLRVKVISEGALRVHLRVSRLARLFFQLDLSCMK